QGVAGERVPGRIGVEQDPIGTIPLCGVAGHRTAAGVDEAEPVQSVRGLVPGRVPGKVVTDRQAGGVLEQEAVERVLGGLVVGDGHPGAAGDVDPVGPVAVGVVVADRYVLAALDQETVGAVAVGVAVGRTVHPVDRQTRAVLDVVAVAPVPVRVAVGGHNPGAGGVGRGEEEVEPVPGVAAGVVFG